MGRGWGGRACFIKTKTVREYLRQFAVYISVIFTCCIVCGMYQVRLQQQKPYCGIKFIEGDDKITYV